MGRQKLSRFAHNDACRNVIQDGKELFSTIKGNWHSFFQNEAPIVLEAGCGRGEYTTGLAAVAPQKNYIGADIKGARIWKGSTVAESNGWTNVAFLRTKLQNLPDFFSAGELSEIWITFPDPRPKEGDEKLRLTSPRYLEMYRTLLEPGGKVFFKTDSTLLFDYTLEVLADPQWNIEHLVYTHDLYQSPLLEEHFGIQTTYERLFMKKGEKIKYLKFNFKAS